MEAVTITPVDLRESLNELFELSDPRCNVQETTSSNPFGSQCIYISKHFFNSVEDAIKEVEEKFGQHQWAKVESCYIPTYVPVENSEAYAKNLKGMIADFERYGCD